MSSQTTAVQKAEPQQQSKVTVYVPLGEDQSIELSMPMVKKFLCVPTRSGKMPSDQDVVRYVMMCKSRRLNPWVGDAYLIGYDSKDGPQFSLITAVQALHKRAELNESYDGLESGIIVRSKDDIEYRQGSFIMQGEALLGGWARVHRKDRSVPVFTSVKLETYSTGRSRWEKDPAGMITKVAEAAALRRAFPVEVGGLNIAEEMDRQATGDVGSIGNGQAATRSQQLAQRLENARTAVEGPDDTEERSQPAVAPPPSEGDLPSAPESSGEGSFSLSPEQEQEDDGVYQYWAKRIKSRKTANTVSEEFAEATQDKRLSEQQLVRLNEIAEEKVGALA